MHANKMTKQCEIRVQHSDCHGANRTETCTDINIAGKKEQMRLYGQIRLSNVFNLYFILVQNVLGGNLLT